VESLDLLLSGIAELWRAGAHRRLFGLVGGAFLALFAFGVGLAALTFLLFGFTSVFTAAEVPGGAFGFLVALFCGIFAWLAYREAEGAFRYALGRNDAPPVAPAPQDAASSTGPTGPTGTSALTAALLARRYEVVNRLGEGGMGLVYAGRDLQGDRFVAIKKMRPELKLNKRDRKRFLREAQLSAALRHPCIVAIYDILDVEDEVYLVFEYVDGQTMDRRLDLGPIPAEELKSSLRFICQALDYAHSQKVVHRDLKPSNIMLTRLGSAKVMDFGIAREIKDTASRLTKLDTSGTLAYMAPEQELGRFDQRSDIFALGVTLYEALTGRVPFPGPNFLLQKEKRIFTPLDEAAPQAPQELRDAVERCLNYDPGERFQSVAELAKSAGVD
jgi:hypothetical protein